MARNTLAKTISPGPNPTAGVALVETAADPVNFDKFALTGREVLVIHNTGGATYTYTVHSTADERGRTGDITAQNIAAGAIHVIGPFDRVGWQQLVGADAGALQIDANNAAVKWGIVQLA